MLANLKDFFNAEEKLGEPVHQKTADAVATALRSATLGAKQSDLLKKILRPANCEALPRVNQDV